MSQFIRKFYYFATLRYHVSFLRIYSVQRFTMYEVIHRSIIMISLSPFTRISKADSQASSECYSSATGRATVIGNL